MATAPAAKTAPAPAPEEAGTPRPLSEQELATMRDLMARAAATQSVHAPAMRIGKPYVTLTNVSLPRRNDKDRMTDLITRGETIYLTDEEAAPLLRADPRRDGRRFPVIRPATGPESSSNLPFMHPRVMSGALRTPGVDARPDPQGSSYVAEMTVPEASPPVPGSEATAGQENGSGQPPVDAIDLPPRRSAAQAAREQVGDPDLIDAVKASMPQRR